MMEKKEEEEKEEEEVLVVVVEVEKRCIYDRRGTEGNEGGTERVMEKVHLCLGEGEERGGRRERGRGGREEV